MYLNNVDIISKRGGSPLGVGARRTPHARALVCNAYLAWRRARRVPNGSDITTHDGGLFGLADLRLPARRYNRFDVVATDDKPRWARRFYTFSAPFLLPVDQRAIATGRHSSADAVPARTFVRHGTGIRYLPYSTFWCVTFKLAVTTAPPRSLPLPASYTTPRRRRSPVA